MKVLNIGPKNISDIDKEETKLVLKAVKNIKVPGEVDVTMEIKIKRGNAQKLWTI